MFLSPIFECNGRNRKYSIYHKIWFMLSGKTVPCMQITYVPTLCNFMDIAERKTHRRSAAIHFFHLLFFSFLICVKNSDFHSAAFNLCAAHLKNTRNLYASQSLTRFIFIRNSKSWNLIQPMNSDAVAFAAFAQQFTNDSQTCKCPLCMPKWSTLYGMHGLHELVFIWFHVTFI